METRRAGRGHRRPGLAAAVLAVALGTGCATTVNVTRTRPAELDLRGLASVAVARLDGSDGVALGAELTQRLFDSGWLEVVEPRVLERALAAHGRSSLGGPAGAGTPAADALPAVALVVGSAEASSTDALQRKQETCSRRVDGRDVEVPCTELTLRVELVYQADLRVADARSGTVLAARSFRCVRDDARRARDARPDPIDVASMIASCRAEVAASFVPLVVPTEVQEQVVLVDDAALPALGAGNRMARRGDWAGARAEYARAAALAEATPSLSPEVKAKAHYALGLGLVLDGRYDDGLASLGKAVAVAGDAEAGKVMRRAQQWKADAERLRRQRAGGPGSDGG